MEPLSIFELFFKRDEEKKRESANPPSDPLKGQNTPLAAIALDTTFTDTEIDVGGGAVGFSTDGQLQQISYKIDSPANPKINATVQNPYTKRFSKFFLTNATAQAGKSLFIVIADSPAGLGQPGFLPVHDHSGDSLGGKIDVGIVAFRKNGVVTPANWSEFTSGRGSYIVGLNAGGLDGGVVGTALTDQENRAAGQHNHPITDPAHNHPTIGGANFITTDVATSPQTFSSAAPQFTLQQAANTGTKATSITVNNQVGSIAGTNAPYIQLLCVQRS